jgi:hypothetical protein
MKSPKPATDTIYPHIKFWWYRTMLNFCGIVAAILKMVMVEIFQCRESIRDIIIYLHIKFWWYRTMLNFYPPFLCRVLAAILKMADILKILKTQNCSYHYVKFYVSIIIQLEVININVRNCKFPIGFYSNPHPIWTPKNMALTPFTTNLKTLGSTRNIYL